LTSVDTLDLASGVLASTGDFSMDENDIVVDDDVAAPVYIAVPAPAEPKPKKEEVFKAGAYTRSLQSST